jgi:hypothetical protein
MDSIQKIMKGLGSIALTAYFSLAPAAAADKERSFYLSSGCKVTYSETDGQLRILEEKCKSGFSIYSKNGKTVDKSCMGDVCMDFKEMTGDDPEITIDQIKEYKRDFERRISPKGDLYKQVESMKIVDDIDKKAGGLEKRFKSKSRVNLDKIGRY